MLSYSHKNYIHQREEQPHTQTNHPTYLYQGLSHRSFHSQGCFWARHPSCWTTSGVAAAGSAGGVCSWWSRIACASCCCRRRQLSSPAVASSPGEYPSEMAHLRGIRCSNPCPDIVAAPGGDASASGLLTRLGSSGDRLRDIPTGIESYVILVD